MRPNQHKRMRGRHRKGPNPLSRSFESNGPDVKIRGTPQHIMEKYTQLARDAQSAGDPVQAENYLQHAEHYYRIIMQIQEAEARQQQQRGQHGGHGHHSNGSGPQPSMAPSADNDGDGDDDGEGDDERSAAVA